MYFKSPPNSETVLLIITKPEAPKKPIIIPIILIIFTFSLKKDTVNITVNTGTNELIIETVALLIPF